MNAYLTLLTGGGLVAVSSVATGLLAGWLGSRRDKRGYEHEQKMAREARVQERLDQAYIALGEYLSRFEDWQGQCTHSSARFSRRIRCNPGSGGASRRW